MKVFCAGCLQDGKPTVVGEKEPLDDPRGTYGLCTGHLLSVGVAAFVLAAAALMPVWTRDDMRGSQFPDQIQAPISLEEMQAANPAEAP